MRVEFQARLGIDTVVAGPPLETRFREGMPLGEDNPLAGKSPGSIGESSRLGRRPGWADYPDKPQRNRNPELTYGGNHGTPIKHRHERSNHKVPADLRAPERNNYFYGKLLDVFHLELEQELLQLQTLAA